MNSPNINHSQYDANLNGELGTEQITAHQMTMPGDGVGNKMSIIYKQSQETEDSKQQER